MRRSRIDYGGKRRWAPLIWDRFGDPDTFVEPFAGTIALLLGRPDPCPREIVCDLNGFICNFWRAMRDDPEAVAYHATWPTIHQDLTARHRWLIAWGQEHREELSNDPDWYDAKAAGWWVWGASNWIGHGWCDTWDVRPRVLGKGQTGQGVSQQRIANMPQVTAKGMGGRGCNQPSTKDQIPFVLGQGASGAGVSQQRADRRPFVLAKGASGQRVSQQVHYDRRPNRQAHEGGHGISRQSTGPVDFTDWFQRLSARLMRVIVLNRDWKSALTPTVLADTPSCNPNHVRAVFLDPPYLVETRHKALYGSDRTDPESTAARESYEWALAHGEKPGYRIAYACGEGDFAFPDEWEKVTLRMSASRAARKEAIYFSPTCHTLQMNLFGG